MRPKGPRGLSVEGLLGSTKSAQGFSGASARFFAARMHAANDTPCRALPVALRHAREKRGEGSFQKFERLKHVLGQAKHSEASPSKRALVSIVIWRGQLLERIFQKHFGLRGLPHRCCICCENAFSSQLMHSGLSAHPSPARLTTPCSASITSSAAFLRCCPDAFSISPSFKFEVIKMRLGSEGWRP